MIWISTNIDDLPSDDDGNDDGIGGVDDVENELPLQLRYNEYPPPLGSSMSVEIENCRFSVSSTACVESDRVEWNGLCRIMQCCKVLRCCDFDISSDVNGIFRLVHFDLMSVSVKDTIGIRHAAIANLGGSLSIRNTIFGAIRSEVR